MESEYFWGTNYSIWYSHNIINRISGVIINVLDSSAVDREFEPGRVKPDYRIGICYFSYKHESLRNKRTNWLARNQDNVLVCPRTVVSVS
jgi:hypothetical protein